MDGQIAGTANDAPTGRPGLRGAPAASVLPPAAIGAGTLNGLNVLLRALTMAALIFAGPLEAYLPTGIALAVMSAIVVSTVIAATSSYRGSIGTISETNGILALVAASIVSAAGGTGSGEIPVSTVLAAIAVSTVAVGGTLLALGALRLGRLVRYIPYPVIGGFQAGIGWLLVQGAFSVSLGGGPAAADVQALLGQDLVVRWLPALAIGVLLLAFQRRVGQAIAIPATLLACVAAFWITAASLGHSPAALVADGWLLGPYPDDALWTHLDPLAPWAGVEWGLLLAELPKLGVIVLVALVGVLLNGTSLEITVRRDVDLDRELRGAGVANLLAGAAGGVHGYQSLAGSTLSHRLGAPYRATGFVCAGFCLASFLAGSMFIEYVPKLIPAVLLFSLGVDMLYTWLFRARRRLGPADHAVVLAVFATVVLVGFVEGVAVGVLAAVVLFAVSSSRINVVKQAFTGAQLHSTALRSEYPRALLREVGRAIFVLRLNGYVFFGTAYRMVHELRARLDDARATPLRFLLLDLQRVSGMDASAVHSVRKLVQYAQEHGFEVVLADTPDQVRELLERAGIGAERRGREDRHRKGEDRRRPVRQSMFGLDDAEALRLRTFPDLDHGLEWCETTLLRERDKGGTRRIASLRAWLARGLESPEHVERFLRCATLEGYLPGEQLLRQGTDSNHLLLVDSGLVSVRLTAPGGRIIRLRQLGAGAVIGEVGFYLGRRRTASVVAEEPTRAYRITPQAMRAMQELEPELCMQFHNLMARMLAERVHDTDVTLAALAD